VKKLLILPLLAMAIGGFGLTGFAGSAEASGPSPTPNGV
jgi:hypothetical protein